VPQVFSAAGNRDPERSGRELRLVLGVLFLGAAVVIGPAVAWGKRTRSATVLPPCQRGVPVDP
jgi:hypothetical protein